MTSSMTNVDKSYKAYIRQGLYLYVALFLIGLFAAQVALFPAVLTPLIVGVIFALVVETVEGLVWKRVATSTADSQATFFMAASGLRFLAALAVMLVYFLFAGRASMLVFVLVFALFYVAMLVHHALFFSVRRGNT